MQFVNWYKKVQVIINTVIIIGTNVYTCTYSATTCTIFAIFILYSRPFRTIKVSDNFSVTSFHILDVKCKMYFHPRNSVLSNIEF